MPGSATPLGPWRIERLLGEGTIARVYAARHVSSRADAEANYALKILRRKWRDRPEGIGLLRREAFVASRVRHANVISVLDVQLEADPQFLVMPRLVGSTLAAQISHKGPVAPAHALWIARQTAEALSAIFTACEMTHGDVKPANIHLSPTGRVTLLDLAFAQRPGERLAALNPALYGSPAYASPEALTSSFTAAVTSDIYSLGVTLYEMLSGRLPFESDDAARLVELSQTARATCLSRLRPDLPRPLTSLVHRLLAKAPLRRPQSYSELIEELTRLEIACFANR